MMSGLENELVAVPCTIQNKFSGCYNTALIFHIHYVTLNQELSYGDTQLAFDAKGFRVAYV